MEFGGRVSFALLVSVSGEQGTNVELVSLVRVYMSAGSVLSWTSLCCLGCGQHGALLKNRVYRAL